MMMSAAPPLRRRLRPPVAQVQLGDVEGKDFVGASGCLVEHPPQGACPKRQMRTCQQVLDQRLVQGAGAVRGARAPACCGMHR